MGFWGEKFVEYLLTKKQNVNLLKNSLAVCGVKNVASTKWTKCLCLEFLVYVSPVEDKSLKAFFYGKAKVF